MEKLINLESYPVQVALQLLLADKTSEKNIVFATGTYDGIDPHDYMTEDLLRKIDLQPRVEKTSEEQSLRTKKKAEVFTPSWVVNQMNNFCDENWFGRKNVFNVEDKEDHTWSYVADTIEMPSGKTWQEYVQLLKMEITCGEAPFIVSRYDPATGRRISVGDRIGVLDRKLRIVGEHTQNESEWRKWATAALKSSYGYEFQGDNLLIARVNILDTLCEYRDNRFGGRTDNDQIKNWAEIIAWNFWQMDGFSGCIPFGKVREPVQTSFWQDPSEIEVPVVDTECKIRDWRTDEVITYNSMKEGFKMKFDFIVGNPPYQAEQNGRALPVYGTFMDATYTLANVVELITPARFLFNAGQTSKDWNRKMLSDSHLKVLDYSANSNTYFAGVDIKGGVAITLRDKKKVFGAIGTFIPSPIMRSVLEKVKKKNGFVSLKDIVFTSSKYALANIYADHPDYKKYIKHNGKDSQIDTNAFGKMPIFDSECSDAKNSIQMYGRIDNKRALYWTKEKYIADSGNLYKYKVFVSKVNGTGDFGIALSQPVIGKPRIGSTQSFLGIGAFETEQEAENLLKYLKGKFSRAMLCTLKITQDNNPSKWANIPLQDFTSNSDIDWSKSIPEIDQQLYKKYGLDDDEIKFIETHVKGMA